MAGGSIFEAVTDLEPVAGGVLEEHRIVVWRSFAGGPLDVFCTDLMEQPGDPVDLRGIGCPERDSILIRGMQRRPPRTRWRPLLARNIAASRRWAFPLRSPRLEASCD